MLSITKRKDRRVLGLLLLVMPKNHKSNFETFIINKIREKRIEKGLSQVDIAIILNVSRGFIGQIESPNFSTKYRLNHLNKLAKEFNCSPKDFIPESSLPES